ncbi:MAG: UPF0158 family protein [Ilumatobacteraceae bacterium]
MARTWLAIEVELVDGAHAPELWPRPGRVLIARPGMTFRMLADAINGAFARWDRSHLHAFTLADGTRIGIRTPWDEPDDEELDDTRAKLSRLGLGEQFVYEFDFGDGWMHLCTVGDEKVDPVDEYGEAPDRPVPIFGWGWIPDQYGRRWSDDDGGSAVPPPPDPPLSDLPELQPGWGEAASRFGSPGVVVPGPWAGPPPHAAGAIGPWSYEAIQDLRGAVRQADIEQVLSILRTGDPMSVAHLVAPALLDAAVHGDEGARVVSNDLVGPLTLRGWLGDDELVAEFDRVLGEGTGRLRPVPVDLDELAFHLDGPTDFDEGTVLDLATGQFWPRDPEGIAGVDEPEDFDDPDGFVAVIRLGSRPGYGDMQAFIDEVDDEHLAERLADAIHGKGAFRRFKDVVARDEVWWGRWLTFSNERQCARARWWLADAGLRPALRSDRAP